MSRRPRTDPRSPLGVPLNEFGAGLSQTGGVVCCPRHAATRGPAVALPAPPVPPNGPPTEDNGLFEGRGGPQQPFAHFFHGTDHPFPGDVGSHCTGHALIVSRLRARCCLVDRHEGV